MPARVAPIIVLIGLLIVAVTSLFTITEAQVAIRTEFGAIVGLDYAPGLHWKWPWDQVVKFDRRVLSLSYTGETFLTNDNRGLIVDFYVKWKVNDASRYFQATGGREDLAGERIAEIVKDGIKGVVAQRTLEDIRSRDRPGRRSCSTNRPAG
jgi:modulator of FtsH protease HflC